MIFGFSDGLACAGSLCHATAGLTFNEAKHKKDMGNTPDHVKQKIERHLNNYTDGTTDIISCVEVITNEINQVENQANKVDMIKTVLSGSSKIKEFLIILDNQRDELKTDQIVRVRALLNSFLPTEQQSELSRLPEMRPILAILTLLPFEKVAQENIQGFVDIAKEEFLPLFRDTCLNLGPFSTRHLTNDILVGLDKLMESLKQKQTIYEQFSGQTIYEQFFGTYLCEMVRCNTLRYNDDGKDMEDMMTYDALKSCLETIELNYHEYRNHVTASDPIRLQAFLVNMILITDLQGNAERFAKYIRILDDNLLPELRTIIEICTRHDSYAWDEMKQATNNVMVGKDRSWTELLTVLGMTEYFPGKISMHELMAIRVEGYSNKAEPPMEICMRILRRFVMVDFRARDDEVRKFTNEQPASELLLQEVESSLDLFGEIEDKSSGGLNPLDVFVAIRSIAAICHYARS